ncbi:MAG: DUF484 family protein [Gammaproteobacteria bacterium]|nr:DUF484 family protein [Gammaproteobacteria bacterium]
MPSLTTHRISSLEARNQEIQDELNLLIRTGSRNDEKFRWLTTSILALYDVADWLQLDTTLETVLGGRDNVDAARLYLWSIEPELALEFIRPAHELGKLQKRTLALSSSVCETTRPCDYERIFEKQPSYATSVAFVPISYQKAQGVLTIGSFDPSHFSLSMSTMFLDFLGEVIGRVVNKLVD